MPILNILWPTFALVALIFIVWGTLVAQRMRHLKANPPNRETFASGRSALDYFQPVEMPAHNLANLFELPVLYFALVPLLVFTTHANHAQVVLAWGFVIARVVHSYFHIVAKNVQRRFLSYAVSVAILLAMWLGFFIDIVAAANVYHDAMAGIAQP